MRMLVDFRNLPSQNVVKNYPTSVFDQDQYKHARRFRYDFFTLPDILVFSNGWAILYYIFFRIIHLLRINYYTIYYTYVYYNLDKLVFNISMDKIYIVYWRKYNSKIHTLWKYKFFSILRKRNNNWYREVCELFVSPHSF